MKLDKYWLEFPEISRELHLIYAFSYLAIGIIGFISNLIVLFYLIR